ncbi:MAG: hypothetical protein LBK64_07320, partial [Spirochaetaceae bacterium]|nr:hypothetical protein [Spirochaetaceae bacterium]
SFYYRWYAGGTYAGGTSATYTPVAADLSKTLTCRVYAVGFAGYKESAATAAVAALAWPSTTALSPSGTPTNGSFSAQSDVFWYSFTAPSATSVTILVNDKYYTSGSQTAYVSVSAYKADGTPFFTNYEVLYPAHSDGTFSGYTGLVYIKITWTDRGDAYVPNGTFTVDYSVTP